MMDATTSVPVPGKPTTMGSPTHDSSADPPASPSVGASGAKSISGEAISFGPLPSATAPTATPAEAAAAAAAEAAVVASPSPGAIAAAPSSAGGAGGGGKVTMGGRLERCKHCTPVFSSFYEHRTADRFTDITLQLPDRSSMRAHKIILASASGALSAHLRAHPDVDTIDLAQWVPCDPLRASRTLVDYMYARQAYVHAGNILGVAQIARELEVPDLVQLANSVLARFLHADPVAMLPSAVQFKLDELQALIINAMYTEPLPAATTPSLARSNLDARGDRLLASMAQLAHLPLQTFIRMMQRPDIGMFLSANERFSMIHSYVERNLAPSHRACLIHHNAPITSDFIHGNDSLGLESEQQRDMCSCDLRVPIGSEQVRACYDALDFTELDPETLSRAFSIPRVPQDLVFQAVMSKLMQLQSSSNTPSPGSAFGSATPTTVEPGVNRDPHRHSNGARAPAAMTNAQMQEFVTATLDRMKSLSQPSPSRIGYITSGNALPLSPSARVESTGVSPKAATGPSIQGTGASHSSQSGGLTGNPSAGQSCERDLPEGLASPPISEAREPTLEIAGSSAPSEDPAKDTKVAEADSLPDYEAHESATQRSVEVRKDSAIDESAPKTMLTAQPTSPTSPYMFTQGSLSTTATSAIGDDQRNDVVEPHNHDKVPSGAVSLDDQPLGTLPATVPSKGPPRLPPMAFEQPGQAMQYSQPQRQMPSQQQVQQQQQQHGDTQNVAAGISAGAGGSVVSSISQMPAAPPRASSAQVSGCGVSRPSSYTGASYTGYGFPASSAPGSTRPMSMYTAYSGSVPAINPSLIGGDKVSRQPALAGQPPPTHVNRYVPPQQLQQQQARSYQAISYVQQQPQLGGMVGASFNGLPSRPPPPPPPMQAYQQSGMPHQHYQGFAGAHGGMMSVPPGSSAAFARPPPPPMMDEAAGQVPYAVAASQYHHAPQNMQGPRKDHSAIFAQAPSGIVTTQSTSQHTPSNMSQNGSSGALDSSEKRKSGGSFVSDSDGSQHKNQNRLSKLFGRFGSSLKD